MPIFAVMGLNEPAILGSKVAERFPDNYFTIAPDKWFVAAPGVTASTVAAMLGMSKDEKIFGLVITVGGYYGWASSELWEWLKTKGTQLGG
jgi:hypothetical protein